MKIALPELNTIFKSLYFCFQIAQLSFNSVIVFFCLKIILFLKITFFSIIYAIFACV